jgi:uncharacterized protein (TIGR00297 family)
MVTVAVYAAVLTILSCLALSFIAYFRKILDRNGCILAFVMGLIIGFLGSVVWLVLLLIFLFSSFAATRYKYELKKKRKVAEIKGGKRGFENVLANGYVPMVIALLSYPNYPAPIPHIDKTVATVMFITALATAASDTLASEIGVFARRTYMITTLKPTKRGINGGVSGLGTGAALFAAFYSSVIGWLLIFLWGSQLPANPAYILIPLCLGFLGCNIDSLLGVIENNSETLTGSRVNLLSIFAAAFLAYILMYLLPYLGIPW